MARGLVPQLIQLPFAAGLNQKVDARSKQPPYLDICKDVQFDEIGGLQTRYPYAAMTTAIAGGGVLANVRRIIANGDELLVFTNDSLYSYDEAANNWVLRGTHLAVKSTETPLFGGNDDHDDGDRAELGGVVFYTWTTSSTAVYVAALDAINGTLKLAPTPVNGAFQSTSARLVPLQTRVLLFFFDQLSQLSVIALDPAAPAVGVAAVVDGAPTGGYDVERIPGTDTAIVADSTFGGNYLLSTVTAGLAMTHAAKARVSDAGVAVACTPDGLHATVARHDGGAVRADYITIAGLADATVNQTLAAAAPSAKHIAAAYRSVQVGGAYRCHVFWSTTETAVAAVASPGDVHTNWVDSAGALGAETVMVRNVGVASRAFDVGGRVFVNLVFGAASVFSIIGGFQPQITGLLQNTYFLYRDDGFLCGKAVASTGAGYVTGGRLPSVQVRDSGSYAWCAARRRKLLLAGDTLNGYSQRTLVVLEYTFDSNEARRCARLGRTLYIAGGMEVLQYDGAQIAEVGFHLYPWSFDATDFAAGNLAIGKYAVKIYWRWDNAQGERDRNTTASIGLMTMGANREMAVSIWCSPSVSHKTGSNLPAAEVWRTPVNPVQDTPFNLTSSTDPSAANPNRYVVADPMAAMPLAPGFLDNYPDAALITKEDDSEAGAILEDMAPPPATIMIATEDRLFLAGVAGDLDRVWYSKKRAAGRVASFHGDLTIQIPAPGGKITALAYLDGCLVVFRETAIYVLPGDGLDNTGGGQNFGPSRLVSNDLGAVNAEGVTLTDKGLVFKSSKGWALLDRSLSVVDMGTQVGSYNDEQPLAVHVVKEQRQIRCLSSSRELVFDYQVGQWSEWTIGDGLDATIWKGKYVYLSATGAKKEQQTYDGLTYGWDIEMTWIKPADLQGAARIWWLMVLGEWRSAFHMRIRLARDYQSDGAGAPLYFEDKYWTPTPTVFGGPLQVRIGPSIQQVEAIKIRLTAVDANNHANPPSGEAAKLTGLGLEVGLDPGLFKRLPAAQKA